MQLNKSNAFAVAKELTIVAMQNNMIKVGASSTITAKNVSDFLFETFNALSTPDIVTKES